MNKLLLVAGVSGAGKSYLESALKEQGFVKGVTSTTRAVRTGEVDGVDYNFKTDSEFVSGLVSGAYIESAEVNGCHYGMMESDLTALSESNDVVYMILDPQGVRRYQEHFSANPDWVVKTVFLDCPLYVREARIESRIDSLSSDKQFHEVAKRLIQTREFEDKWCSMVTSDVYIEKSGNSDDIEHAINAIIGVLSLEGALVQKVATMTPSSFSPNAEDVEIEINRLKKALDVTCTSKLQRKIGVN